MKDNRQVIDDIDIRNNCTIIKRGSAAMPQVYPNAKDVDYLFILGRRVQLTASGFKKLLLLIPINASFQMPLSITMRYLDEIEPHELIISLLGQFVYEGNRELDRFEVKINSTNSLLKSLEYIFWISLRKLSHYTTDENYRHIINRFCNTIQVLFEIDNNCKIEIEILHDFDYLNLYYAPTTYSLRKVLYFINAVEKKIYNLRGRVNYDNFMLLSSAIDLTKSIVLGNVMKKQIDAANFISLTLNSRLQTIPLYKRDLMCKDAVKSLCIASA